MEFTLIRFLYGVLVFITPLLIVPYTSELFEFNKMIVIYSVAVLTVFLFLVRWIRTGSRLVKMVFFTIPLAVFVLTKIVATVFSMDIHTSIMGYYGRFNGGLMSLAAFGSLAVVAASVFTRNDVLKLLKLSLLSSTVVMLWGLPSRFGRDMTCWVFTHQLNNSCWTDQFRPAERMFSTLGQPNWLGSYLALNLFVAVFLFTVYAVRKQRKLLYATAVYIVTAVACILFTKSRSSLVAVGAGGVVFGSFAVAFAPIRDIYLKHKKLIGIVCAAIIILILNEYVAIDRSKAPLQTVQNTVLQDSAPLVVTDSIDIRRIVWQGAIELGLRYPLFGTGPETFATSYNFVRPVQHNTTSEWDFIYNKAHNEFLDYLATTGFIGLGAYLFLIGSVYWYGIRRYLSVRNKDKPDTGTVRDIAFYGGMVASFTAIHVTNFFGFSTSTINLYLFLIPALMVAYESQTRNEGSSRSLSGYRKIILGFLSAAVLYCLVWIISFHVADVKYARALEANSQGEYYQAVNALQSALKLHYEHVYEDKLSSAYANLALVAPFQDGETHKPEEYIAAADALNVKTLRMSPHNVQYWKTRGKNQYLFYQALLDGSYLDEAIRSMRRAQELAPTDPKYPYTLALFLSLRADDETDRMKKKTFGDDAMKSVRLASSLKPDYIDARMLAVKLSEKYEDADTAQKLLNDFKKDFPYASMEAY